MKRFKKTFILIHGSWHGGWVWYKVKKILSNKGYNVYTPTLSMFGDRNFGLKKHVKEIKNLIIENNLFNVILVGHSYAGLVITEVASQLPKRIEKLVYLDAFIPNNGESLFDLLPLERVNEIKNSLLNKNGQSKPLVSKAYPKEYYLIPPREIEFFGVKNKKDKDLLRKKLVPMSVLAFEEKVSFNQKIIQQLSVFYIRATNYFIPYEQKAKELGWKTFLLKSGHDVMLTKPRVLSNLLEKISKIRL